VSTIIHNTPLSKDFFLLKIAHPNQAAMGQFYMARCWDSYPILSRPISVFDADDDSVSLLCKIVGEGTELLAKLRPGDDITLDGPYGNGFPLHDGRLALVGGGVGIAPLYLAAKTLRAHGASVDLYLGFSDVALLTEEYDEISDNLTVDVGGYITDKIDPAGYDAVYTCGPDIMMRILAKKCAATATPLLVSMENRMACGLGACLVCSCKTTGGNKKVCKDGPVFRAEEVYFDEPSRN
jgi:dihydroorotate dehydrogenase electron transfer subunit